MLGVFLHGLDLASLGDPNPSTAIVLDSRRLRLFVTVTQSDKECWVNVLASDAHPATTGRRFPGALFQAAENLRRIDTFSLRKTALVCLVDLLVCRIL